MGRDDACSGANTRRSWFTPASFRVPTATGRTLVIGLRISLPVPEVVDARRSHDPTNYTYHVTRQSETDLVQFCGSLLAGSRALDIDGTSNEQVARTPPR